MMPRRSLTLAGTTLVLLVAGIWLTTHRNAQQADMPGGKVFTDLTPELGNVNEIRLSKGDGSRTTLRKDAAGWTVVERQYPADASRVRELVLALVDMKIIEHKTSDPASYARLGVEKPDSPAATSTLVEVVAGKKTWSLIVGKGAEGRAIYVRKPAEAASALVEPSVSVDPDQKRWIDRLLTDIPGANVHDIQVRPAAGPAYLLTRAKRGDTDLALSPVPKGRNAASSMSLDGQADTLSAFHFDDVITPPAAPATAAAADHATFRTFDGQVIDFTGHRDGAKAYVTVAASRDPALAAQFPENPPASKLPAAAAAPAATAKPAAPAKPTDQTVEKLAARAAGLEYEIPAYKYEALFKSQEDLLEKKPEPPPKPAKPTQPVKAKK